MTSRAVDRDAGGLDPGDLGRVPLEMPGHVFLRQAGFLAAPLQLRAQAAAAQRGALVNGHCDSLDRPNPISTASGHARSVGIARTTWSLVLLVLTLCWVHDARGQRVSASCRGLSVDVSMCSRGVARVLADQFFLIAHEDRTGRSRLHPRATGLGLAAALLGELMLTGRAARHRRRPVHRRAGSRLATRSRMTSWTC